MIFISQMKKTKVWLMSQSKWVEPQVLQGCLISKPCSSPSASLLFQTGPWREKPQRRRTVIHFCLRNGPVATPKAPGGWL